MARFSDEEIRRYARQMVLPEIGGVGQARLRNAHAVVRGEAEALYLAGAGVGRLTVPSQAIADAVKGLNPLVQTQVQPAEPDETDIGVQSLRALEKLREVLGL